jgi:hypothetical protein
MSAGAEALEHTKVAPVFVRFPNRECSMQVGHARQELQLFEQPLIDGRWIGFD